MRVHSHKLRLCTNFFYGSSGPLVWLETKGAEVLPYFFFSLTHSTTSKSFIDWFVD